MRLENEKFQLAESVQDVISTMDGIIDQIDNWI
jgi:hypothetical protein